MKITQTEKEQIYQDYLSFIDNMCDDLDTFSEVSPKELVYAVLGLVDDLIKNKCPSCSKGKLKEMSLYDDMDGMLTCDKCGVRVKT